MSAGCPPLPPGDLWVFGYGSLMWDPGFDYVRAAPALLRGYHRAFCVYSVRYRGTPEQPGLVLGLDRGGACRGVAFLVAAPQVSTVIETLWAREMSRFVYRARQWKTPGSEQPHCKIAGEAGQAAAVRGLNRGFRTSGRVQRKVRAP